MQKQFKIQKRSKKRKALYIKICPKCRSINVQISHQGFLSGLTALGLPTVYRCKDCGFSAKFFPEVNYNDAENIKKVKKGKDYKINFTKTKHKDGGRKRRRERKKEKA